MLSSHLHLGPHKGLFPVGLTVKILKALLPSYILATWPAHRNLLELITQTILGERYKLWSSLLISLLHSPFSSPLGPNNHLKILFSNTLSLHTSFNARDNASEFWYTGIIFTHFPIFTYVLCSLKLVLIFSLKSGKCVKIVYIKYVVY